MEEAAGGEAVEAMEMEGDAVVDVDGDDSEAAVDADDADATVAFEVVEAESNDDVDINVDGTVQVQEQVDDADEVGETAENHDDGDGDGDGAPDEDDAAAAEKEAASPARSKAIIKNMMERRRRGTKILSRGGADGEDGDGDGRAPEEDADFMDVINESLEGMLDESQAKVDAAFEAIAKKRGEIEALESDIEEARGRMERMREQARQVADDDEWTAKFEMLRSWTKRAGHCQPRRNWKANIDAEEKALGNWTGRQRRDERLGKLNPFKKAALERLGMPFDVYGTNFDVLIKEVKDWIAEHGKLPETLEDDRLREAGISTRLLKYRAFPRHILGEFKPRQGRKRKDDGATTTRTRPYVSAQFTQERIDALTEVGLDWGLNETQVRELKERGYAFPPPEGREGQVDESGDPRPADGDVEGLENHAWLTMFEALVTFKKERGHTYVTRHNASEELHDWVVLQRRKMTSLMGGSAGKNAKAKREELMESDGAFCEYQSTMLAGVDFVFAKGDLDWMENYERLVAFKTLFGTTAVTHKFVCFEALRHWLDEEMWLHLKLPELEPSEKTAWIQPAKPVHLTEEERKRLLDDINALEVPLGEEERLMEQATKSNWASRNGNGNFFFRTAAQVQSYDTNVLKGMRERRNAAIRRITGKPIEDGDNRLKQPPEEERAPYYYNFNAEREARFFLRKGAVVAASVGVREKMPPSGASSFYKDGRSAGYCRISGCFSKGHNSRSYLCNRHWIAIEMASRCDKSLLAPNQTEEETHTAEREDGDGTKSNKDGVEEYKFNVEKERQFFWRQDKSTVVSIAERQNLPPSGSKRYYKDGRSAEHCRVSSCFSRGSSKQSYLCDDHFRRISHAARSDPSLLVVNPYKCGICEERFPTYGEAAKHERRCGIGAVEVATLIPPPGNENVQSHSPWMTEAFEALKGEAKVLAEGYQYMVRGLVQHYRKDIGNPKKHDDKNVNAALGAYAHAPRSEDENLTIPSVKFPSEKDETESHLLFRCCAGPLAATFSGREGLVRAERTCYGDGRGLKLCRVSGCRGEHSGEKKRFFCDWHHGMIAKMRSSNNGKRKAHEAPAVWHAQIKVQIAEAKATNAKRLRIAKAPPTPSQPEASAQL